MKILIMLKADPNVNPRPNRMILHLSRTHHLTILAKSPMRSVKSDFFPLVVPQRTLRDKVALFMNHKLKRFEKLIWTEKINLLKPDLLKNNFDIVICYNIDLLPLALAVKKHAKVIFDAREYYPTHFDDRFKWRLVFQDYYKYLCRRYLAKCDKILTVSKGIADEYHSQYRVNPEVLQSLPAYHDIQPSTTDGRALTIIHHGNATRSRGLDQLIDMAAFLDERFNLDLMLMPNDKPYLKHLKKMAAERSNVEVIPPVAFEDIIPFISRYDIGLCFFKPSTFNLKHVLPNKFFEFIQARLALAVGPSPELKPIVETYQCGLVSNDFTGKGLADALNRLTTEQIDTFKRNSQAAAQKFNANVTAAQIDRILKELS